MVGIKLVHPVLFHINLFSTGNYDQCSENTK